LKSGPTRVGGRISLTVEPLHIPSLSSKMNGPGVICLMHIASKETTHAQTVKLTPVTGHPRRPPTGAICKRPSVKTDQTARISLQIPVMSKSRRQNKQGAPHKRAPPILTRYFAARPVGALPRQPVWRSVPRLSAAGEALFTDSVAHPQPPFSGFRHVFYTRPDFTVIVTRYAPWQRDFGRPAQFRFACICAIAGARELFTEIPTPRGARARLRRLAIADAGATAAPVAREAPRDRSSARSGPPWRAR